MPQREVTIIVSDLHMSDGGPSDDFVSAGDPFPRFVSGLLTSAEGQAGKIELFINGDFLDFVQANEGAYTLNSAKYWCSESESLRKLDPILEGHKNVFSSLRSFRDAGNAVTIIPGNHDIDFYWSDVQDRLRQFTGDIAIDIKPVWHHRYGGKLRIAHGNHIDPANCFKNPDAPEEWAEPGLHRLEMCAGTLFVVRFVNWLGRKYPFANNVHPATRLNAILRKEDRFGFVSAAWMLSRFMLRHPKFALNKEGTKDLGSHLLKAIQDDDAFAARTLESFRKLRPSASVEQLRKEIADEDALARWMMEILTVETPESWLALFDGARPQTAGFGDSAQTLQVQESGGLENDHWQDEARKQWSNGAEIVVMGHTHLPDALEEGGRRYFNPGSWTRYLDIARLKTVRLKDLEDEQQYPYQLNFVRVEEAPGGSLVGSQICFERRPDPGGAYHCVKPPSAPPSVGDARRA